jgi:L-malate glycosyltransferase
VRVLHITNWYPNYINENEAIWINSHIDTLNSCCNNSILHFEHFTKKKWSWVVLKKGNLCQHLLSTPFKRWFFIEWIYFGWLFWQLVINRRYKDFDIINFHIAYPMLTYWHWIKRWIKVPVVIAEHWSAYHFNFGVERELPRIQRIFKQNIPVIAVSQALVNDIKNFAKADFPSYVIPNVVDEKVFFSDNSIKKENFFFMVSQWKYPKNPFPVMAAFLRFNEENQYKHRLKIGGYGVMWSAMTEWVKENDTKNTIYLLGIMESTEIANAMRSCKAFLHPTYYETFSVVCAEAVACGAIVAAPNVGGIPEVVNENCILLENWEENDWYGALKFATAKNDEPKLQSSGSRFSHYEVGKSYYKVLNTIISEVG